MAKVMLILCLIKIAFYFHNYNNQSTNVSITKAIAWGFLYDCFCIALINLPLLLILLLFRKKIKNNIVIFIIAMLFAGLNTFCILLNLADVFYYSFHQQRADADLLYVLKGPANSNSWFGISILIAVITISIIFLKLFYNSIGKLLKSNSHFQLSTFLLTLLTILFFYGNKKTIPTYPLVSIPPTQLPLAQNSFHTFIYSLYRLKEAAIPEANYLNASQQKELFTIHKKNNNSISDKKNIVLFIMESVPYDFFDSTSPYKVAMPFLDSLVKKSTFYNNAYSYSYTSNKGITAILSGIPTITDIPLYHSSFTSLPITHIGDELAKSNYTSSFFIGDHYDDFGFAKCTKWLGFQHYYSMESIPNYKQLEKHTMGLHDEYVLDFMQQNINETKEPFFSAFYNISTHFPNDLPNNYKSKIVKQNFTTPMKTMQYYNDCLQHFFEKASQQSWYKNTVFIFCSDHWYNQQTNK